MARKLQVALLIVGALAMMSLTCTSALGLIGEAVVATDKTKPEAETLPAGDKPDLLGSKKLPDSSSSCFDRAGYSTCKAWKYKGYCGAYTYKGWSVPYFWCKKTCYKCNKCVDLYPKTCYVWKYKGFCAPKYTYGGYSVYKTVCPKSCGYCH